MLEFKLEDEQLMGELSRLASGIADTTPLMRAISQTLMDQTEENFARQGRPAWLGIKPRSGREGGKILQDSGRLAASITPDYGPDYAKVGTNVVYAAIHQLGGKTKPHAIHAKRAKALAFGGVFRKSVNHPGSNIPARPFLPITAAGSLQPEAESAILEDVQHYLRSLVD